MDSCLIYGLAAVCRVAAVHGSVTQNDYRGNNWYLPLFLALKKKDSGLAGIPVGLAASIVIGETLDILN